MLGVGPGADVPGTEVELGAVGVSSERRVSGMLSIIDRMRRLWRDEEPNIELLPKPFSPAGPGFPSARRRMIFQMG